MSSRSSPSCPERVANMRSPGPPRRTWEKRAMGPQSSSSKPAMSQRFKRRIISVSSKPLCPNTTCFWHAVRPSSPSFLWRPQRAPTPMQLPERQISAIWKGPQLSADRSPLPALKPCGLRLPTGSESGSLSIGGRRRRRHNGQRCKNASAAACCRRSSCAACL